MVDLPGTRFGRYTVARTLGTGAFSTVYEAVDEQLETTVALKVLAENHALDPDIRERFLREAQLLRRIQCPNVIDVYDVGESDRRQPYLVMAFASGGDLDQRITQLDTTSGGAGLGAGRDLTSRYTPTPAEVLDIAGTLAASLGRAHDEGLVHRDVKPPNLLLITDQPKQRISASTRLIGADERVVLADLGLAKDLQASSGLTIGAGTTGFGAPEQLSPASTITAAVDVYASSAVILWLYTRQPPSNDQAVWDQLPAALVPVLRRGLADSPAERHPTIQAWHTDITDALKKPGHDHATPTDTPTGHRRRLVISLAALLLGVTLGAGIAYAAMSEDTPAAVTEDLGGGMQQVTVNGVDAELTITGPATITAGEQVTLEATTTTGNEITWFVPSGETSTGPTLTLTARRPGTAIITAVTGEDDQPALVTTLELWVNE